MPSEATLSATGAIIAPWQQLPISEATVGHDSLGSHLRRWRQRQGLEHTCALVPEWQSGANLSRLATYVYGCRPSGRFAPFGLASSNREALRATSKPARTSLRVSLDQRYGPSALGLAHSRTERNGGADHAVQRADRRTVRIGSRLDRPPPPRIYHVRVSGAS
jgi:hypothetical protein